MPELGLKDTILTSLNAQEPWPENVKLFQPYEVEQILLPDNASCLAVQAFLKMCNLPFEVEMRWNSEFMSPSGRVPFIKCGAFVVSELEPIVQFAANKGVTLTARLSTEEKAEMRAYISLITNVLVNAELYISWVDNDTYNAVTKVRNSSVYPWPLGWIQTRSKRASVIKRLKALHWNEKTLQNVLADVEQCCNSLTQRLGDRDYFFGTPTPLDALLYGHIRALLSAVGPKAELMIKPITSPMLALLMRMTQLTNMKLTAQEDYLVSQAFMLTKQWLTPKRVLSVRNTVKSRSNLYVRQSRGELCGDQLYGFKPFASKKMTVMQSQYERMKISCHYETEQDEYKYDFIFEILDRIMDKVEEVINYKDLDEHHDFEIIYPQNIVNISHESSNNKINDGLPIDVKYIDTFDTDDINIDINGNETIDIVDAEDLVDIIEGKDSESSKQIINVSDNVSKHSQKMSIDSSNPPAFNEEGSFVSSSNTEKTLFNFDTSFMEDTSADSKTTIKPNNISKSFEDLLKFLRERNSEFKNVLIPDLD